MMAGMMTSGVSGSDTMVEFLVTGVCRQEISRTSDMNIRVPRSRMSQTMQNIHRMGGTIVGISCHPLESGSSSDDAES